MNENFKHSEITKKIIQAFYTVYNTLGYGFLEKVYENAMMIELKEIGLQAENQWPIKVIYNKKEIGSYFADIMLEENVIVELKVASVLREDDTSQLLNYLKGTEMEVGLLLNFGKEPEFRRKVFSNNRKN